MDRLERLVNLVAALIDAERPLTREQLRERVGGYAEDLSAFRRTFERDKDLLRTMGLPLATEPLDPDRPDDVVGYRIPRERYELPDPGLDDSELAARRLAASAVQIEGGGDAPSSALRKLGGEGGVGAAGSGHLAQLPGGPAVALVFQAVAERRRIRFGYRGQPRVVDPWRMSYRNGQWYLAGWDHGRQEERTFRLDRVEGDLEPQGDPGGFERPAGGAARPPVPWRLSDDEEVVVDLLVDASQARWAEAAVGESAVGIERLDDGGIRLGVAVTNRAAFRSFVLGLLEHAEI
ncbi:MAG: helix-turn-helix transcriptional regulator, partial [Acidimicrobiales bacterium]